MTIPQDTLGRLLSVTARAWRREMDNLLKPMGMSQARWLVLLALSEQADGEPQRDLAAYLNIEGPTLVRVLDKLEKEGWVERREFPPDKRCKTVHLCEKAQPMLKKITATATQLRQQLLEDLPPEDIKTCCNVIETIRSKLESKNA